MSTPTFQRADALDPDKPEDMPYGRSRDELDFWMGCVGAPIVLADKTDLTVRRANANAAIFFGLGLESFGGLQMENLVGREASLMLLQIWSVAPIGVPGEPFLIKAVVQEQERLLMVQVTKLAVEGELVRLFTFMDAPPQGSVALAGWQENIISMLNWLPFGFEIASADDQIQFANSTFKELFGYTQDEIESIEDWWRLAYPDPQYREYARLQWNTSIADARRENREMTPFDLNVMSALGTQRMIQFRHRTIGNFNVNLYIDVTQERAYAAELKLLANTDPLTGIMNRRRFFEEAEGLFAAAAASSMGILMLDIDHFKTVNDTYGHRTGDLVLTEFTRRCREVLGPLDRFARLGGEEFAILLDAACPSDTIVVGERIRAAIGASAFDIEGTAVQLTVSIGATVADPSAEMFGAAISRADKALYEAKHAGRNCVVSHVP